MVGKKISCPKCRRSYDNKIEYCPFCGSQNPLLSASEKKADAASLVNNNLRAIEEDLPKTPDTYDKQDYYDESVEYTEDYEEDTYYESDEDQENTISYSEPASNTSELSTSSGREKIDWTDEEDEKNIEHDNMYDENGEYNPNYDHYYDDTKAKIDNELERLSAEKEKAILKIIGGTAAVIGTIVYLILTL